MSGWSTIALPTVPPPPVTTLRWPAGQPALVEQHPRERDRRQRSLARGLQHDRAPGRDRGRELVRDEVEREVERADRADHADRHPQRERELAFAGRARVHRHHVAGQRARRDRRERERRDRALRLDAGGLDRLRRLGRDDPREVFGAFRRGVCAARSRISARFHAASGPGVERGLGGAHRVVDLLGPARRDPAEELAVVRRAHLDPLAGGDRLRRRWGRTSQPCADATTRLCGCDLRPSSPVTPCDRASDLRLATRRSRPGAWVRGSRAS